MPCSLQTKVTELLLFRLGMTGFNHDCLGSCLTDPTGPGRDNPAHPLMFIKSRKDVLMLDDNGIQHKMRTVELTQERGSLLKVSVSQFIPLEEDKTAYEWMTPRGVEKMEMSPYCIVDMDRAVSSMKAYVRECTGLHLKTPRNSSNRMISETFEFAGKLNVS